MSQRWTPSDRQAAVAAITENWTPDVAITSLPIEPISFQNAAAAANQNILCSCLYP
jgi:hypothetical protein